MAPLITMGIAIFMIFGFFPLALMTYATVRDKKAAKLGADAGSPKAAHTTEEHGNSTQTHESIVGTSEH